MFIRVGNNAGGGRGHGFIWSRSSEGICSKTARRQPDPQVYVPSGSGSTGQRYGSGSGSFYHHAKIVRKTLILSEK
jgi:hypothetical protein